MIGNFASGTETLAARLDANEALIRRQARRVGRALGVATLAAGLVVLVAIWAGAVLVQSARAEAEVIRAGNLRAVAEARAEGERALAALWDDLAEQRAEAERGIEEIGVELAGLAAERDAVRAELTEFAALRERLGIQLIEGRTQPVIIVPEGREIRLWRAAGLHELARYNGRMYRVVDSE